MTAVAVGYDVLDDAVSGRQTDDGQRCVPGKGVGVQYVPVDEPGAGGEGWGGKC